MISIKHSCLAHTTPSIRTVIYSNKYVLTTCRMSGAVLGTGQGLTKELPRGPRGKPGGVVSAWGGKVRERCLVWRTCALHLREGGMRCLRRGKDPMSLEQSGEVRRGERRGWSDGRRRLGYLKACRGPWALCLTGGGRHFSRTS